MTERILGPVHPTSTAKSALRPLFLGATAFAPDSLLGGWQARNANRTLPHCVEQLDAAGALDNLRRVTGEVDGDRRNMWFSDSDVYKTLEAAAWQLGRDPGDAELRAFLDTTAALVAKAQEDDGYLNSYFSVDKPDLKWRELHWSHELYCAGHLIQAAVAAARAGVGAQLVTVARRFADLIVERFAAVDDVDGHPEIETALVELYRVTGHRPYLDLALRFLDLRGHGLLDGERFGSRYLQDHVPVRAADEVAGHVVRQLYLLAGVVDVAVETRDDALLESARRLWADAFGAKTYLTGAQGSRHRDEAFGDPYELPPDRAYGETCAAIASFQWNWRLLLATGEGKYADEMERALYNAIAGSTALDGTHFFYSNPLHLRTGHDGSHEDAPSQRLPWYSCACCPPNLARLVASLSGYVATTDPGGLQVHLYAAGTIRTTVDGVDVRVETRTRYPWDGRVELTVTTATPLMLSLRVPGWAGGALIDGVPAEVRDGYAEVRRDWTGGTTVTLELPMAARVVRPHPRIDAVRGCVAVTRGPLVYCLEQADLPHGVALEDVRLDPAAPFSDASRPDVPVALTAPGRVEVPASGALYGAGDTTPGEPVGLTAVPYFLWGNRERGPMRVWIPVATE
ncbi:beta-L-arabinofuranosidase domain-containing protein [Amycolatopsis sp. DG1A-15b]|uniref:glycoside hydrolase family 127 protein n=1 Tax=Amycolatopsis sp. DG1A-15b TaxID=3052846 RepID=UPI00255B6B85|nr:beta-L-arabinofuranosidase domain-containing protein [Amycolatopsis sp. DG1A-15b]WIX90183.1 glycoside hydrolase family 127 protein [Amycolatopsis sp. DG1A-15b]